MNMATIPSYFIYDGFDKDLDASMVYKRLMNSTETSNTHSHALTCMCSCIIGKWRLIDAKPFLPQLKLFGILPSDARQWAHSQFINILFTQHIGMVGKQCHTRTWNQQSPTNRQHIPPLKINTAGIPVYQIYASAIQVHLKNQQIQQ